MNTLLEGPSIAQAHGLRARSGAFPSTMSAAHDAHADASAGHQDTHNHFDNEPATELGADETRTANWVPYLGLALFFSAGLACLMCSDGDKLADGKAVAAEAAPSPPTNLQPAQMPRERPAVPLQPGQPGQPGAQNNAINALKQLSPEQAKELQKRMDAMRAGQNKDNPAVVRPAPQPGGVPQPSPQAPPVH